MYSNRLKNIRWIAVSTLMFAAVPFAQQPSFGQDSKGPKQVASVEGIVEYRLDNGLQVLLFEDNSKPVVTVNLTIFVGSRHEGYGEAGMAHLLEHMLFKGTPNHEKVPALLQDRGADFNGTTWLDRTNYYETLPAENDNLEFALRLEADRMINSYVKAEDLQSEMTVVRNEFEQGENSPSGVLQERMFSAAFQWHNYGNSTIGNRSDIERVPIHRLQAFYRKYYRPDNAMLVVAGKFDRKQALGLVEKYFGVLESPDKPLDPTYTREPAQEGERTTVVRRVGASQFVGAAYHIPAGADPEYPAVEVLAHLLSSEPSGRLYQSLVLTKKASAVMGGSYGLHDPGLMFYMAQVAKDAPIENARFALIESLESISDQRLTDEEVERAKVEMLKDRELRSENTTLLATELTEWAAQGDWRLYFLFRDRLEALKTSDVQAVAEKYLKRSNRTVGLFIPSEESEKSALPAIPNVKEMLSGYQGREAVSAGEEFDPSPEAIEARTKRGTLKSGMPYTFLQKKTRGDAVNIALTIRFGDEQSLFGKVTAANMLASLMTRGTQSKSYQQLKDRLDKLQANVSFSSQGGMVNMRINTKKSALPELLPLVKEILREPLLSPSEMELVRSEQLVELESRLVEPDAIAAEAVMQALNRYPHGDVRNTPSQQQKIGDLKELKIEDVQAFYRDFLNGTHGDLVVVGDFEPNIVIDQFNSILDNWKSSKPFVRPGNLPNTEAEGKELKIETPDKENAVYYASQQYALRDDDPRYPALVIGNYILGGGSLSSRLGDRVRQKDGLSYGVGSGVTAHPVDARTTFTIFAIANPGVRDKLVAAIREEIERLLKDGITAEELDAAKKGYLQAQQVGRSNDGQVVIMLAGNQFAKRTMTYHKDFEQRIQKLSIEDVNKAVREFIKLDGLVIATAGDFAGSAEDAANEEKR